MVTSNGPGQSQSAACRVMKFLTGACLLTSVAAGRALHAPIGGQNTNFLVQNGRRPLADGQDLAQFRQGRTLTANPKEKKMTTIHHKKATHPQKKVAHHAPSTPGAKPKAKPAPSSAPKKPPQTAPGANNSRQKIMLQIGNEAKDAFLSATANLNRSFPIARNIINQATSVLDAEAKDLSLKKSPNGPEMLGTKNLIVFSRMMDGVVLGLGVEAVASASLTPTKSAEFRKTIADLQDLSVKADLLAFPS